MKNHVHLWTSCPTAPAPPATLMTDMSIKKAAQIVCDTPGAVRSRVQCGTTAGHLSSGSEPEAPEHAADLRFPLVGRAGLEPATDGL